jgi:UDPglucose 6-dehydrogenase
MRVSVFGLGKLGSPLVAVLAAGGNDVVGVDLDPVFVEKVDRGLAPVFEPGLAETLNANRDRIRATLDGVAAVLSTDISFVITPTPSLPDGTFAITSIVAAMSTIGAAIAQKQTPHVVVVTSTVMPGATGGPIREALEHASGRSLGTQLGLVYSPQFIALGAVLENMRKPDMVLVGQSSPEAGDALIELMRTFQHPAAVYCPMNFVDAEITKLAVNTYVTTKISYANMLAEFCERTPGANVDVVTNAVGRDSRIGSKYLKGAVAYGGPCFPRDNKALAAAARACGAHAGLAEATDALNEHQTRRLHNIIASHADEGATVAVLGLAYKQDTDVVECSPGLALARSLIDGGFRVVIHDPLALENARRVLPSAIVAEAAADAIAESDVVVLATPSATFRALPWSARGQRKQTIIDCWRLVDATLAPVATSLVRLGEGPP